jgi:fructosamine-3-kinase
LTPHWFGQVLGRAVRAVDVARIGAETGLASEVYRCELHTPDGPFILVAKLWSAPEPSAAAEVHFYRLLAPGTRLRLAHCHCAEHCMTTARAVLLLEDLSALEPGDCLVSPTAARATALARRLAELHAGWWNSAAPALQALPNGGRLVRPPEWHNERRSICLSRYAGWLHPTLQQCVLNSQAVLAYTNSVLPDATATLVHGDVHLDNVLWDGNEPVLLDWARCQRGPAVLDLAALLGEVAAPAQLDAVYAAFTARLAELLNAAPGPNAMLRLTGAALLRRSLIVTLGTVNWPPATARARALLETAIRRQGEALAWLLGRLPEVWTEIDRAS